MTDPVSFQLISQDSGARSGKLTTRHGTVDTPAFMAVGTHGSVKGLTVPQLEKTGSPVMLVNAFHMAMRPGGERIEELGGLHEFTSWKKPILTDSGGFQVFSLESLREIDDDGATFRSPLNGSKHRFTPENVMELQAQLGGDITMQFDECAPYPCEKGRVAQAMRRSVQWAKRGMQRWLEVRKDHQAMFPIVQGGVHIDLREESVQALSELDAPGYGIGGLSVGEGFEKMMATLEKTTCLLPENKPRYLMGVGKPEDLIHAVARGTDMFDCVMPSRNGRNGTAFTSAGVLKIKNAAYATDLGPIDENCLCVACQEYSRATLHHFMKEKLMTAEVLLSIHNLTFYQSVMRSIREAINENRFQAWAQQTLADMDAPAIP